LTEFTAEALVKLGWRGFPTATTSHERLDLQFDSELPQAGGTLIQMFPDTPSLLAVAFHVEV